MTDRWKRCISLLLAALLLTALAACGGDEGEEATPTEAPAPEETAAGEPEPDSSIRDSDTVYAAALIPLPDAVDAVGQLEVSGDRIYFLSRDYQAGVSRLYYTDLDGDNLDCLDLPTRYNEAFFAGLAADGEGGVWACQVEFTYDYDRDTLEDLTADYTVQMIHVSGDLEIVETRDMEEFGEETGIQAMVTDGLDSLCLLVTGSTGEPSQVQVYGLDMEPKYQLEYDGWISEMAAVGGTVCLYSWETGLVPIDAGTMSLGEPMALDAYGVYSSRDGRVYYGDGGDLLSCDLDGGDLVRELSWMDLDIAPDTLNNLLVLEDGSMVGTVYNVDRQSSQLAVITPVSPEAAGERTELTLATLYAGPILEAAVADFNRESGDYRVVLEDYGQYNTDGDEMAGRRQLYADIASGNAPDLIDLDYLPAEQLIAEGLLMDLYPFLDGDDTLLAPGLLSALDRDGGLYELPTHFSVCTVVGAADDVGTAGGWTAEAFLAYVDSLPEGVAALYPATDAYSFLRTLVEVSGTTLINWSAGESHFAQPWFVSLLEYCGTLGSYDDFTEEDYALQPPELIMSGRQTLQPLTLGDVSQLQIYVEMFGGDLGYIGYPGNPGGSAFSLVGSVGISATCTDPDGAWAFIQSHLRQDSTNDDTFFPALASKLEEKYAAAMAAKGGENWIFGDLEIEAKPATQGDVDSVHELIEGTALVLRADDDIWEIIQDDVQGFFSGDLDAQATAELIDEHVGAYLNDSFSFDD